MPTQLALFGARLLLAVIFLDSGLAKLGDLGPIAELLGNRGFPLPWVGALGAGGIEVVAALALILGVFVVPGALVLAAFTLMASVMLHGFWAVEEAARFGERVHFLKNLAIVGGLVALAAGGAGRFALQSRNLTGKKP